MVDVAALADSLSARQLSLAQHAIGFGSREPGFRNYFCADPDGDDDREWAAMLDIGAARLLSGPRDHMPYNTYGVAKPLFDYLLEPRS